MPQPHTGESLQTGRQLWTFDGAGNLVVAGGVFVQGVPDPTQGPNGPLMPGVPVATASGGTVVTSVTAGDASIAVTGTAAAPVLETGTLDQIATLHPPAGAWSNNGKKITSLANGSAASDAAAFGQIPTTFPPQGTATGAVSPKVVALVDAATIAVDASQGNDFRVTLGGNRTLGAPSNPTDGQRAVFQITQDGTGSRTLAYNAVYEFSTSLASPTLSTGAGVTDLLGFIYNATKVKWLFVAFVSGFA